jgi:hypothetical protein
MDAAVLDGIGAAVDALQEDALAARSNSSSLAALGCCAIPVLVSWS